MKSWTAIVQAQNSRFTELVYGPAAIQCPKTVAASRLHRLLVRNLTFNAQSKFPTFAVHQVKCRRVPNSANYFRRAKSTSQDDIALVSRNGHDITVKVFGRNGLGA